MLHAYALHIDASVLGSEHVLFAPFPKSWGPVLRVLSFKGKCVDSILNPSCEFNKRHLAPLWRNKLFQVGSEKLSTHRLKRVEFSRRSVSASEVSRLGKRGAKNSIARELRPQVKKRGVHSSGVGKQLAKGNSQDVSKGTHSKSKAHKAGQSVGNRRLKKVTNPPRAAAIPGSAKVISKPQRGREIQGGRNSDSRSQGSRSQGSRSQVSRGHGGRAQRRAP